MILNVRRELDSGKSIYELSLRVCYYARVSTDHELQATSIVNQVDYFKKYIDNFSNWVLVQGYVDEGISGKEAYKRENFMQMIHDGEIGKFDLVLTKSVSRFARNTIDSIFFTNHLLEYGIGVIFLNDNINTFYGDSEFRLTLMASIAQDELRKLSESVKFGLRQSISRGIVLGNNNLLGYKKDKGKLIVVEEEALIVRDVFDFFLTDKYSYREVARIINEKYHKDFDSTRIKRILLNYKYKGYYCGKKSEIIDYKRNKRRNIQESDWIIYLDYDKVPPIVEEEVWNKVQIIIKNRSKKRKDIGVESKYRGKIFCVRHERLMKYKRKKYKNKYYYYFCCKDCCTLSEILIDRIGRNQDIEKIFVYNEDVLKLVVKCQ